MDKLRSLYIDCIDLEVRIDDFIVAIGKRQSNSVYHVAEVRARPSPRSDSVTRYHMKVYKSDLITALKRDSDQILIPMTWYSRNIKK